MQLWLDTFRLVSSHNLQELYVLIRIHNLFVGKIMVIIQIRFRRQFSNSLILDSSPLWPKEVATELPEQREQTKHV